MPERKDFEPRLVVKNTVDGTIGVVCSPMPGALNVIGPEEIPVVYDHTTHVKGTPFNKLQILHPENAVANPDDCGVGGKTGCMFLFYSSEEGWQCQRFGSQRFKIILDTRPETKRHPDRLYPDCQLP